MIQAFSTGVFVSVCIRFYLIVNHVYTAKKKNTSVFAHTRTHTHNEYVQIKRDHHYIEWSLINYDLNSLITLNPSFES